MEPADAALAACGIAAAFAVASFTGVIVDRLPKPLDEPNAGGDTWDTNPWREVLGGRSHCLTCGAPVAAYDNIPVVSYLVLLGRCRSCKQRFGIGHVLLELLIPALLILMTIRVGVRWMLIPALVAVPVGVAIAAIDFRTLIVPTRLVWPAAAVSFVTGSVAAIAEGHAWWIMSGAVCALTLSGPLFAIWWFMPRGMGLGDVRLCVLLGWTIGLFAAPGGVGFAAATAFWCLALAAAIGLVMSVVFIGRGRKIPFGPALVAAAVVLVMFAEPFRTAFLG